MRRLMRPLSALLAISVSALLAAAASAETITGLKPADPPAAQLKPGLATEHLDISVRHVDGIEIAGKGRPGPPLPALDNSVGSADDVLGSGKGEGIAFRMRGFLKVDEPGLYEFAAMSNDGVRFQLDGQTIVEDPDVHADRLSEPTAVELAPGWYPLYLLYFQRKGTWTIELLWKAPGRTEFEPVPASQFAHLPG